ncbi:ANK1 [Symbiodinium sp. KB8]|nr:ANK1 [Symbiodinium sp. KB8]
MSKRKSSPKEADEEFEEVEVEGEFWEEEEYLDWESEETQAAAQGVAIDLAFQKVNRDNAQDATPERQLLRRLEKVWAEI